MTSALEKKSHAAVAEAPNQSTQLKALIVDDDHITLKIVFHMLSEIGFHVEISTGGLTAMHCLNQSRYDLVITDFQMPGMDGYALSKWLKNDAPETKVIMMTGCRPSEVIHCMENNAVDCCIFKPFSLKELYEILSDLLQIDSKRLPGRH